MYILYNPYFGSLRLLTPSNVEENPGPSSSRRSCCVVCRVVHVNILDCIRICQICLSLPEVEICFFLRLLSLPDATFPSSWFRGLVDRCSCSRVRLISFDGSLHTCVKAFRQIDSAVMSVDVFKS